VCAEAANVGGVAVSGLEMAQNSQRLQWTRAEVDEKLRGIMTSCYELCADAGAQWSTDGGDAKEGAMPSLLTGANVAGFIKVANASKAHGDWW
jgi:glutamate dehydrogenase (NADP+)